MVLLLDFYLNLLNFPKLIFYSHTFTVSILQLACCKTTSMSSINLTFFVLLKSELSHSPVMSL